LFELTDLSAERLLGNEQTTSSAGEVEFLGDGHERTQVTQLDVHGVEPTLLAELAPDRGWSNNAALLLRQRVAVSPVRKPAS
jgi:hypothetical protein